ERGGADPQDGDPVAPSGLPVPGLRRARLGPAAGGRHGRPPVSLTAPEPRPPLAGQAPPRDGREGGRVLLLSPQRGLVLNQTAADVLQLCTGEHTVAAIVDRLVEKYVSQPREEVERQVTEFLKTMTDRGLVLDATGDA